MYFKTSSVFSLVLDHLVPGAGCLTPLQYRNNAIYIVCKEYMSSITEPQEVRIRQSTFSHDPPHVTIDDARPAFFYPLFQRPRIL